MNDILSGLRTIARSQGLNNLDGLQAIVALLAYKKILAQTRFADLPTLHALSQDEHPQARFALALDRLGEARESPLSLEAFRDGFHHFNSFSTSSLQCLCTEIDRINLDDLSLVDLVDFDGRPGEVMLPIELADLILDIGAVSSASTVYAPFAGSWLLALKAAIRGAQVKAEFCLNDPLPALLATLLGLDVEIRVGDPIASPAWVTGRELDRFELSVSNPPFGVRYRGRTIIDHYGRFEKQEALYGETLQVRHILAQTDNRAVIVLPNGFLFRTASAERSCKEDMVRRGWVSAVISFPGGLMRGANVPFSLLVLDKSGGNDKILFVDAEPEFTEQRRGRGRTRLIHPERLAQIVANRQETEWSRLVSASEVSALDYNLEPKRYAPSGTEASLETGLSTKKTLPLDLLATLLRAQVLPKQGEEGHAFSEVALQDIEEDGYVRRPSKSVTVGSKDLEKARSIELKPGDILLAIRGATGRVGMVPQDFEGRWLPSQTLQVVRIRPDAGIAPVVLMRYLRSEMGQALLRRRTGGSVVPSIQTKDLRSMPVLIPTAEETRAIERADAEIVECHRRIMSLRDEMASVEDRVWSFAFKVTDTKGSHTDASR